MIIIILGFKRNPRRDEIMIKTLVPFLRETIQTNFEDFMIIVSGWKGEAQGIKEFLVDNGFPSQLILVEPNACRTFENIVFSFRILFEFKDRIKKVIFIGETRSKDKVLWLAPRLYRRIYHKETTPDFQYFPLPILKSVSEKKAFWLDKFVFWLDKLSFYCPPINIALNVLRKHNII